LRFIFQRQYLFHIFFWLMYAVFMLLDMQGYVEKKGWAFCILPLLIYFALMALLVYVNILVLIPLVLQKKKVAAYIAGLILLGAIYMFLRSVNQSYWDNIVWSDDPMSIQYYFKQNTLYAVWFALISSMLFFTQKWYEQRQQVKNIQISQLQTELKYLRSQINPHFLFNGLNTIYGNIDMSNQQARNILLQFADLLRYNLYEADVDWVELEKEALYLENYVALQRARSDSNLQIELHISITDKSLKVAPLIFIAFVENSFKFSTRDDNRINRIRISLQQMDNKIVFECANSYEKEGEGTGGIGLSNVKRRLELLYKDKHALTARKDQGIYSVQLILFT
jgi:two-component system, LytTR family, sensor kinase